MIAANRVHINGAFASNAARLVDRADSLELVADRPPFVSRGGLKLDHALHEFGVEVGGVRVLDAGASTGGFTDCLLQRGALEVVAVDVGYGQLHESLRHDPRVTNRERTNIRDVCLDEDERGFAVIVGDLSFMSMGGVVSHLTSLACHGASLVLLIKPQFEATKSEADKGSGVIRDPVVWRRVLETVASSAAMAGAPLQAATTSPIRGGDGNFEFLFHLVVGGDSVDIDLEQLVSITGQ